MKNTTNTTNQFTLTEYRERLRALAAQCQAMEGHSCIGAKIEVDERTTPVAFSYFPTGDEAHPDGDDLAYSHSLSDPKRFHEAAGLLRHGAVVHVRIYARGGFDGYAELRNIFTVWLGTPEQDGDIISAPGFERQDDGTWRADWRFR